METLLTAQQALGVLRRLEPRPALTYQQLRDLERRGCIAPRVMSGGRSPRVYGLADVLLLRLAVRMQDDPLLRRWQVWSVLAHLREALVPVLVGGQAATLLVQGARGRLVRRRELASMRGVDVPLVDLSRGVRAAMRSASGEIWSGAAWVPASVAARAALPLNTVTA